MRREGINGINGIKLRKIINDPLVLPKLYPAITLTYATFDLVRFFEWFYSVKFIKFIKCVDLLEHRLI